MSVNVREGVGSWLMSVVSHLLSVREFGLTKLDEGRRLKDNRLES